MLMIMRFHNEISSNWDSVVSVGGGPVPPIVPSAGAVHLIWIPVDDHVLQVESPGDSLLSVNSNGDT